MYIHIYTVHTYIDILVHTYKQLGSSLHVDPVYTSAWNTLISGRYVHTYVHMHVIFIKIHVHMWYLYEYMYTHTYTLNMNLYIHIQLCGLHRFQDGKYIIMYIYI
jgi:hypothetical protein